MKRPSLKNIIQSYAEDIQNMLINMGLPDAPDTKRTAERFIAGLYEMTSGYSENPEKYCTVFPNSNSGLVILRDIAFTSLCAHHSLPFTGTASVAYLSNGEQIIGLSKLARIVDTYAKRWQVQEDLTNQICQAIQKHTAALGTYVVVRGVHSCMTCRGVRKSGAEMVTEVGVGALDTAPARMKISSKLSDM